MAEMTAGPAPYIYVGTRMRVRKSKLLPREEYLRMLNMSIPEITRSIEELEYKKEIDEFSSMFSGIDLLEISLSWNLAKEFQKVLDITPGTLKEFTKAYLRRWDIQNILTIIRGKTQGIKPGKIKEILIPAGEFDTVFLDRLLAEDSPERVVEALKATKLYPVLAREFPQALQSKSFSRLENEMYKQYYANLIDAARGVKGGHLFLNYISLDIDVINIRNLFRLRSDVHEEDVREMMITGGTFSIEELQRLNGIIDRNEFIDALVAKIKVKPLLAALEDLRGEKPIRETETDLIKVELVQMEKMSKLNPFSIHPILVYLEKKKYEVFNLRAIARGKESRLSSDRIKEYLVM
ncbi:MAG TPA: V-type ATP synthase subunit C [Methanoregulaceae archaeon]|nr:V-type ATP synthase subunit C [Methanoregulaceae archaeon]